MTTSEESGGGVYVVWFGMVWCGVVWKRRAGSGELKSGEGRGRRGEGGGRRGEGTGGLLARKIAGSGDQVTIQGMYKVRWSTGWRMGLLVVGPIFRYGISINASDI